MASVQLKSGEWFTLGNVTSKRHKVYSGVKLLIVKTTKGEIVFNTRDQKKLSK